MVPSVAGNQLTFMMKKKSLKWKSGAALVSVAVCAQAAAQSSDALLDKLVQKGILTTEEAKALKEDSKKDLDKAIAAKSGLSSWVSSLKFSGDFRFRYDGVYQDQSNSGADAQGTVNALEDRHRLRYRLRFGATADMSDHFEVGLRLGSGEVGAATPSLGGSVYSANTTLNNDASRKFIFVDLAYAKWKPTDWLVADVGKMNSAFWFTDMVLDPDYNPEGAQQKFTVALNPNQKIGLTAGEFVLLENYSAAGTAANNDVYLFMGQADWAAKWSDKVSTRVAVGGYAMAHHTAGAAAGGASALETFLNQNGTPAFGTGAQNFNPVIVRGEVTYTLDSFPLFSGPFPITLGAEYAKNPGAHSLPTGDTAYNFGVSLGSAKKKGNWLLSYNYKNIGTAAVWHGINDDDFGYNARGGTDVRGHQVIASYRFFDPMTFNLRFMRTEEINNPPGTSSEQTRLFADLLWTF